MNKRGMIALVLLLPVLAVVFLLGTQSALAGHSLDAQATLCVKPSGGNGCEATIGDALDGAGDGDSIRVATGTYTENVVITKAVTLEGGWNLDFSVRDPAVYSSTIRPADTTQSVVSIEDADPTLDGFVITGAAPTRAATTAAACA